MGVKLNGSSSGSVELNAPADTTSGADVVLTLPVNDGDADQVLSTNGSGALSFVDRMTAAGPTFSAYLSSNQTVSNSTWTKVELDTEDWDTNSNFDNTTNYRFTPTVAGYYQINFRLGVLLNCTRAVANVYKNGSEVLRSTDSTVTFVNGVNGSGILYMNGSSDYIELYGLLTTTAGTREFNSGADKTFMSVALIRPA